MFLTLQRPLVRNLFDKSVGVRGFSSFKRIPDLFYSLHTAVNHSSSICIEQGYFKTGFINND